MFQKKNMKQAMGEEEVGARNAAGKHAVHLAGKRWFLKSSPGFLAVFPIFRCRRKQVKFFGEWGSTRSCGRT